MWSIQKGFKLFPIEMLVLTKRSSGKEFKLLGIEVFLEVETAERENKKYENLSRRSLEHGEIYLARYLTMRKFSHLPSFQNVHFIYVKYTKLA